MTPCLVVIGVPNSGKSSFISALSHILEFQEIPTRLRLARLPEDGRYLQEMRGEWEDCNDFERTKAGLHPILLTLVDELGHEAELSFPDIAGEEFDKQWSSRSWTDEYRRAIEHATGVLMFVNIQTFRKPYSKADEAKIRIAAELLGDEEHDEVNNVDPTEAANDPGAAIARMVSSQKSESAFVGAADPSQWEPEDADEQAKLVDILQGLVDYLPERRWRLGVVVSAWEIEHKVSPEASPKAWLKRNATFLHQYLESNASSFECSVFGVSAQGGNPANPEEAANLRKTKLPSERVLVVTDTYTGHDLTEVVFWMMRAR